MCFLFSFSFPGPPEEDEVAGGAIAGGGDWRVSADCHFHLVCCLQLPPLYAQTRLSVSQGPLLFSVQPF